MPTRAKDEGRVYLRRSTSKQETGVFEQLNWALAEAAKQCVRLDANAEMLQHLVTHGDYHTGAIYLDDGISGSDLQRPGFVALRQEALANRRVSHVFIHISDRFARPEQAVSAMQMEIELLLAGVTIQFMNRTSEPRERGLHYFERDILLLHEYTQNGEFLNRLAVRVLQTQAHLARHGFRTGGNPPYGFMRVLMDAQGKEVQELPAGMTVRREGCHVALKPHDRAKIQTWLYILHLYGEKQWGMHRIANHLNDLGIPAPDAGKSRRIGGKRQTNSGRWSQRAITRLISNAAIIGQQQYGRASVGTHRRYDPEGPRTLREADRKEDGAAKPVQNSKADIISVAARHAACADEALFARCQDI